MDWLHCNKCYLRPSGRPVPFFATTCAHVVCDVCCPSGKDGKRRCLFCKGSCTILEINEEMPERFAEYFRDPTGLLKRVLKILQFQQSQCEHLVEYEQRKMNQPTEKSKSSKEEDSKLKEALRKLKDEKKRLGSHIEDLNKKIKKFKSHQRQKVDVTPPRQKVAMSPLYMTPPRQKVAAPPLYLTPIRKDRENPRNDEAREDPDRFISPVTCSSFATPKRNIESPGSSEVWTPKLADAWTPPPTLEWTPEGGKDGQPKPGDKRASRLVFSLSPIELGERPEMSERARNRVRNIFTSDRRA